MYKFRISLIVNKTQGPEVQLFTDGVFVNPDTDLVLASVTVDLVRGRLDFETPDYTAIIYLTVPIKIIRIATSCRKVAMHS